MSERPYDVVVLGAGPVGENVAQYAAEGGLTVALVEGELVGGECSYYACIPSKVLLRPFALAERSAHVQGLGRAPVDRDEVLAARDAWVHAYDDASQAEWAESAGLTVVRGHGRLTGERRVAVGDEVLVARHAVVLATGSVPVVPDAYADVLPWGSRDATGVREVPDRLAIVGGGVVACEAATWLSGLGARVTMLVRGDRLLSGQEPFAGEAVRAGLEAAGVDVRLGATVRSATRSDPRDTGLGRVHGGAVTLVTDDGEVVADEVLVATGRRPRLDDVGLDAVGLTPDDVTGGRLPDWLVAVGDASGEAPLTHWGKYRARVVGDRIADLAAGRTPGEVPDAPVPQVVFTDPEVASVGATEREASEAGVDLVTARVPFNAATGTVLVRDDAAGEAQLVVDRATGRLLGATFVGPEAAELVHGATIAITGGLTVRTLRHAVPVFPTASELWLRLLEELPRELR